MFTITPIDPDHPKRAQMKGAAEDMPNAMGAARALCDHMEIESALIVDDDTNEQWIFHNFRLEKVVHHVP